MTSAEFGVLLTWLLLPTLALATTALVLAGRFGTRRTTLRLQVAAWFLLLVLSTVIAFLFVAFSPSAFGRHLGVRDSPFMWAPFAFIAVALALAPAIWWASLRRKAMRPNPSFERTPDGAAQVKRYAVEAELCDN